MSAEKPRRKKPDAPLEKYRGKRDFDKTPEPGAEIGKARGNSFVIQEHHARSHHFDFRLEMDGVLASWAVPKGIPEDTAAKRLAVHVEDHPLDYGAFEGVIPKGNYGAGTVAIWDKGTWEPAEKDWRRKFAKGKLKFFLRGGKLDGAYALARMGEEPNWLLRRIEIEQPVCSDAKPEHEIAGFIPPQLARTVPTVPAGGHWLHEIKFDGYRLIVVQRKGVVGMHTRSGLDWTARFSSLAKRFSKLTRKDFVIDGEAVVFDTKGRSRFGDLQAALQAGDDENIEFVAFDLLHFGGLNLRNLSLSARRTELGNIIGEQDRPIRLSKVWHASEGSDLFKQACSSGLEGIISKNANGRYIEGSRRDWTKSKCRARQEFVVCGYTPPKGDLPAFGALVLGSYEKGKLVPRGKVGTGFSDKLRRGLLKKFKPLHSKQAPFKFPETTVTWLEPRLVAEIEFAEITRDGSVRQGSFIGLREDKNASDVHMDLLQTAHPGDAKIKVAGIVISHPERMVYPDDQVSKLEVAQYYERVGKLMLPYVRNRPLAVLRAPEGLGGETFFQKSFTHLPPHVFQKELEDDTTVFFIKDVKGLVSLAQFGVMEFHIWGAPLPWADKPDFLTWDLDPDPSVPWPDVLGAAMLTRNVLQEMGLSSVVKTSGGKGLHVVMKNQEIP
jgi:bifunctional non-homologous end joining protein LigD